MGTTGRNRDRTLELLEVRLGDDLARGTVYTTALDSALTDLQAPPGPAPVRWRPSRLRASSSCATVCRRPWTRPRPPP